MEQRALDVLEYPKILARLAAQTSFGVSRDMALNLMPSSVIEVVRRRQAETTEAQRLMDLKSGITIGGARDIGPSIRRSRLGGILEPTELLDIHTTLVAARTLRTTILKLMGQLPLLAEHAVHIAERLDIEREISRCLNDRGEVTDDASPALRRIRGEIRSAHSRLMQRLNDMISSPDYRTVLQEPIVTMREGRYVIPVKAEHKGALKGVVHAQSASGATLFVEPLATVDLNNQWRELQLDEKREVDRILATLSRMVAVSADELEEGLEALGEIDLALAKARYAESIRAIEPQLVNGDEAAGARGINLINARHPLLTGHVVPISIWLGDEFTVLVITGPNTGGKTVALKTLGLLTLMAQAGLHIPADEGSRIRVFDNVYADIGDEQSIEQSLSTFSSHMTHIVDILQHADPDSLVLLDELGAGTDPAEGSALARAILSRLLEQGIWTVATTHYPELKAYAHTTAGVENASVEFDIETLAPTYKLSIGLPGMSNALAIATRLGLSHNIVEGARKLLDPNEVQVEGLLAGIRNERIRAADDRRRADEIKADAEKVRQRLMARLRDIDREREELILETRRSLAAEVEETKRQLRQTLLAAQRPGFNVQRLSEAMREVKTVERSIEERLPEPARVAPEPPPEQAEEVFDPTLRPGVAVRVRNFAEVGELVSIAPTRGEAEVQLGSFKLKVPLDDVERARGVKADDLRHAPAVRAAEKETPKPAPSVDLDLRGWRADDVKPELESYLDESYLAGMPFVRIIHGKGTGVLRQVVREQLAHHPLVKSFHSAEANEGGEGVTVAVFKG